MKLTKALFETVKTNLVICEEYLNFYPQLKSYIEAPKNKNTSQLWDDLIRLKISYIANFLKDVQKHRKYLTGESKANYKKVLNTIKRDIDKELESEQYKPTYTYYNRSEHMELLVLKENWSKINTKEEFFKVITENPDDYYSWDYNPFYPLSGALINLAVNNNLEIKNDYALSLEDYYTEILEQADFNQSLMDTYQLDQDKETLEKVIALLLPICERESKKDSCWSHNFLNNKVVSVITRKING